MPDAAELLEIYTWLEAGLPARQALAKQYPASRFSPKAAPTSDEWSQLVLEEAKQRLKKPETYFSGVMQLKGCANRWVGLPAAEAAGKLFTRVHLPRREAEWKAQEMADMLKHHHAAAQSFTRYLLEAPPLGKNYQRNRDWAKRAILYWNLVRNEDKTKSEEAQKQIEALEKFRKGQLTGMKE